MLKVWIFIISKENCTATIHLGKKVAHFSQLLAESCPSLFVSRTAVEFEFEQKSDWKAEPLWNMKSKELYNHHYIQFLKSFSSFTLFLSLYETLLSSYFLNQSEHFIMYLIFCNLISASIEYHLLPSYNNWRNMYATEIFMTPWD